MKFLATSMNLPSIHTDQNVDFVTKINKDIMLSILNQNFKI
jgi:hypothetical protein